MYICEFCETQFKFKKQCDEHSVCCEFVDKRKDELKTNIDLTDDVLPSPRMMYELVKHLMVRNQYLEREVDELRKFVRREKSKINVIDYLNNHHFPSMDFPEMMKMLVVQSKHLEAVFEGNIVDGVFALFIDLDIHSIPIAAFSHKNSFYVYKEASWHETPQVSVNAMFDILSNRFMKTYRNWEKSKPEFNVETEEVQKQKMILLRKVLGTSMNDENKYRKFTSFLFDKLKKNVKNIVEYEFD
jgi:uncharacterized protein YeeX (DUF496 family)